MRGCEETQTSFHRLFASSPLNSERIGARLYLALILLLALAHGLAYAVSVPIWQAPDEPMLYEYAALTAELGRLPQVEDRSPALEQQLAASLSREDFWRFTIRRMPEALPQTMAEVQALYPMPRQVGGDPPLYFMLAALPLRLTAGWPPERQVLLLRLLNMLLLPAVVACAYGAACEVFHDQRPTTNHRRPITDQQPTAEEGSTADATRDTPRVSQFSIDLPLAVAALVACHPMFAAISASLSNDGLANLLGAALCWAILRLLRVGASLRGVALLLGLLALGLLSKRTLLPYVPLLALLGAGWTSRTEGRGLRTESRGLRSESRSVLGIRAWPQVVRPTMLGLVMFFAAMLWIAQQFDFQSAALWTRFGVWTAPARVWPDQLADDPALRLAAGELNLQPFPAVGGDRLRGRVVRYGARLWSDVPARGQLIVFDGVRRHEWFFEIRGVLAPEVELRIPAAGRSPWFGVAADSGWFYADDFRVIGEGSANNLLMNSGLDLPSLRPGSLLWPVARYLRLPDIAWSLASGYIAGSPALGSDWLNLLFASFWGHFGWMDVPFVLGSWWQPLLALFCLVGLLGTLRWLLWRQGPLWQRRQTWTLLLLVSIAVALPVINAISMPRDQALQQGRYLFPELVAVALLLALGQSALLPASWRRGWLLLWLCFWPALGLAALVRVFFFYA